MTLLEGLVALVILGLATVGYLDVFQASTRSVGSAAEWTEVVSVGESTMESVLAGAAPERLSKGYRRDVHVEPWREGLNEVSVRIVAPDGLTFEIRRLVRAQARPGAQ